MAENDDKNSVEKPVEESPVIDEDTVLIKNPEVTVREEMEEDGKYILFNAENELILVVNATGKFILDSCDGQKTVGQVIRDIADKFTVEENMDLSAIVKNYTATLVRAALVKIKPAEESHET